MFQLLIINTFLSADTDNRSNNKITAKAHMITL